jgi:hypothetical protein
MTHRHTLAHVLLSDFFRGDIPNEFRPPIVRVSEILTLQILSLPPIPPRGFSGRQPSLNLIDFLNLALIDSECVSRPICARSIHPPHAASGLESIFRVLGTRVLTIDADSHHRLINIRR